MTRQGCRNGRLHARSCAGRRNKDNHIAVAGSIGQAVGALRTAKVERIIVEADRLNQIEPAIQAGATARQEAPVRSFDVQRFCGDPTRAEALLGWRANTTLERGFAGLVADFRARTATRL